MPVWQLDTGDAGLSSVIWATGYTYDWLDPQGQPRH
jgi:hypothetical protein